MDRILQHNKWKIYEITNSTASYMTPYYVIPAKSWLNYTVSKAIPNRDRYVSYIQDILEKLFNGDNTALDSCFWGITTTEEIVEMIEEHQYIKLANKFKQIVEYTPSNSPIFPLLSSALDVMKGAAVEYLANGEKGVDNISVLVCIKDVYKNRFESALLKEHWPEVYLAWMTSIRKDELTLTTAFKSKTGIISCPVDVNIYDESNRLVAQVIDDTVQEIDNSNVSASVFGESDKVFVFPDNQVYHIELIATDCGTMDYCIIENSSEGANLRTVQFFNIPLVTGDQFEGEIDNIFNTDRINYSLVKNGTDKIYADYDSYTPVFATYTVTFSGLTTMTTDVEGKLSNLPVPTRNGYTFNGWYTANGTRITTNTVFTEDTIVYASWSKTDSPTMPSYNSNSSSDSNPMYSITVPNRVTGGIVKAVPTSASEGQRITITAKSNYGYELSKLTVTDSKGSELELTDKGDGKYTFTMPKSKVDVKVEFVRQQTTPSFDDVQPGAYYADAVAWAVEKGITAGTSATTFSPNSLCTRAQIVTFLWRAAGSPKASVDSPFIDVPVGSYYYDAVLWAVEHGITSGTSATTFSPDATCTRGQVVTFLYRHEKSPVVSGSNAFTDVPSDAYYAKAVQWAVSNGVTAGTSATTFNPDATCTRSQIVTFLYRDMA